MSPQYAIADTSHIITPALVIFRDIVAANLRQMVAIAGSPSRLRPHCKTHKMAAVTQMELELGITKHKCATIAEAEMLAAAGVTIAVITGRRSKILAARCRELGIRRVLQGVEDKSAALDKLLKKLALHESQVACIGDDTPDIPLFVRVGLAVAVRDAHPLALRAAHCRTRLAGGQGAVREVCDWLLAARSHP